MSLRSSESGRRDSVLVTVCCALALAFALIAIVGAFVPYLDGVAVFISAPAVAIAIAATGLALLRNSRLILPALTLLVSAVPAARYNWQQMRIVWVESDQICRPPRLHGVSLVGLLGSAAEYLDHKNVVGSSVCRQLGRRFTDSDCDAPVGRIKCE